MKIMYFVLVFCILTGSGCAIFSETSDYYQRAVIDIQDGRVDFAILHLRSILKNDPDSPYAAPSAFAVAEHYFDNGDNFQAIRKFSDYVQNYYKDKGVIFAKLIIYKLVSRFREGEGASQHEAALIKEIRKELFAKPLFLVFYDKKAPRSYSSLFNNTYLVYDYVDKIKVFRNGQEFLELTP